MASKIGWMNMTRPSLSPLGLLSSLPMEKFLKQHFPVSQFEDLSIPFAALSFDLERSEEVVLKDTGDMIHAIRASCAVPGVFSPMRDATGRMLVDGGVVAPMPTDAVRQMGADIVIAVDLIACGASFRNRPRTALGMMFQSSMALLRSASRNQHYHADIVVEPAIAHLRPDEIAKRKEFIALGRAAAEGKIDEIKSLI
jgi:NTE family protein